MSCFQIVAEKWDFARQNYPRDSMNSVSLSMDFKISVINQFITTHKSFENAQKYIKNELFQLAVESLSIIFKELYQYNWEYDSNRNLIKKWYKSLYPDIS